MGLLNGITNLMDSFLSKQINVLGRWICNVYWLLLALEKKTGCVTQKDTC